MGESKATREWNFETDPTKLALEMLAAYRTSRMEHFSAGMTVLLQRDQVFDVAYAWAVGAAVLVNPDRDEIGSVARMGFGQRLGNSPADSAAFSAIASATSALVAASVNRDREEARDMWLTLSLDEQARVIRLLLSTLMMGFDRTVGQYPELS